MADNRKYYYLKLKENFFDSDSIVLLEDMKDGILYSNILLKLYLKSLKNGGCLLYTSEKAGEDFWIKSERLFYCALIGYIWYEAPEEEKNFTTLLEMIRCV